MLARNAASAAVPSSVMSSTIGAASVYAAGQTAATGAISAKVAALTEGVLKVMLVAKLRSVTTVLLVLACMAVGTAAFLPATAGQQPTATGRPANVRQTERPAVLQDEPRKTKVLKLAPGMVAGEVSEVDAQKNLISVSIPTSVNSIRNGKVETKVRKNIGLQDLPIRKDTTITIKGEDGTLADIAVGANIIVQLEVTNGTIVVKGLEVLDK
jgi:hypothetical protein